MAIAWPVLAGLPLQSLPSKIAGLQEGWGNWDSTRGSAVCVLFIPPSSPQGFARLLLTRRSLMVKTHRGQIGLAGGRAEIGDRSPGETALRELHEELGVDLRHVHVVGVLPAIKAMDAQPIIPVVCCAAVELDSLSLAVDEVAYAFAEPWPSFERAQSQKFRFNIFGNWRQSESFRASAGRELVWGLTALILYSADLSMEPGA